MPDLHTVPSSPGALGAPGISALQRPGSSQQMPPPPAPAASSSSSSLSILPSNQNAVKNANVSSSAPPALPSPQFLPMAMYPPTAPGDNSGVGPGPGPLRHPRPVTAADLHLQLEKEQEAVVNRLSREISLLRASQNASVESNASSTSASASASASGTEPYLNDMQQHMAAGPGLSHPAHAARHHRRSSSMSQRSITANAGSVSTTSLISGGISSPAPFRPGQAQHAFSSISMSRQNSAASHRSRAGSPSPALASQQLGQAPGSYSSSHSHLNDSAGMASYFAQIRAPQQQQQQQQQQQGAAEMSPGMIPATSRYEETAFYRGELESVKRENDALRRRVRELERQVRDRRASDISSRASHSNLSGAAGSAVARGTGATAGVGAGGGGGGGGSVSNEKWNRSESVGTTISLPPNGAASVGGPGGARVSGQRESPTQGQSSRARPRVVSMLSTASMNVGVSEEEVKVGESAASAGLRQDG